MIFEMVVQILDIISPRHIVNVLIFLFCFSLFYFPCLILLGMIKCQLDTDRDILESEMHAFYGLGPLFLSHPISKKTTSIDASS